MTQTIKIFGCPIDIAVFSKRNAPEEMDKILGDAKLGKFDELFEASSAEFFGLATSKAPRKERFMIRACGPTHWSCFEALQLSAERALGFER